MDISKSGNQGAGYQEIRIPGKKQNKPDILVT
jgi:hypothetical protein